MATSKQRKHAALKAGRTQLPRVGRTPDLLRKGGSMTDKSKVIPRKRKHDEWCEQLEDAGIGDQ